VEESSQLIAEKLLASAYKNGHHQGIDGSWMIGDGANYETIAQADAMRDQGLEIPTDVRELVEHTLYQVEKAFT
jgi:hypothetical protein